MRRAQTDAGSQPVRNLSVAPTTGLNSGTTVVRTNLCTNPRGTAAFAEYSSPTAQTITTVTGLSGHPEGITTANRVTYGSGSNPGISILNPVTAGMTYTMSAWVYHESLAPTPGSQGLAQNGVVSQTGAPALAVGVWQRLVWTHTAAGTSLLGFRVSGQSGAGTFSYLITGAVIENSFADTGYFYDGNTAASGDFTYSWAGAANASSSRQNAPTPTWINSTGSAIRALYQSGDRPHGYPKFTRTLNLHGNVPIGINPTDTVIKSGVPRTDLIWARASRALDVKFRYRTADGAGVTDWGRVTLPANQWTLVRAFGTPNIGDNAALGVLTDTTTAMAAGDTIDIGGHMCVEGTYTGDYIDGTKPFSKWEGGANNSVSIGYPPQLLDFAGKPAVDIVGAGTIANIAVDPYIGRTFYQVYEVTDTTGSFAQPMAYGNTSARFLLQSSSAGSNNLAPRSDFPNGSVNANASGTNGRIPGRAHVFAAAFADGLASSLITVNGAADTSRTYTPGDGWAEGKTTASNVVGMKPLRTLVYYADHDRDTRLAISRYLGNKYGAAVA